MSAIPPGPDAGGDTNRVRCAYCGANNFPSSTNCWQCGRPLQPLRAGGAPSPAPSSGAPWTPTPGALNAARPVPQVSSALAPKAAATLGLLFPWAGLPIGLAFLMLDDPRKVRLGWIAIGWSVAGTIISAILFVLPLAMIWPFLKSFASHPPGGAGGGLPNLPPLGGGDEFLSFPFLSSLFQQP